MPTILKERTGEQTGADPASIYDSNAARTEAGSSISHIDAATGTARRRLKPVSAPDGESLKILVDMIMSAHGRALEQSAGLQGAGKQNRDHVESIAYVVFSARPDHYASLESQSADLAVRLATGHCFPDGNKRTAVLAAAVIMEAYGRAISCSQEAFVEAALHAAEGLGSDVEKTLCP